LLYDSLSVFFRDFYDFKGYAMQCNGGEWVDEHDNGWDFGLSELPSLSFLGGMGLGK
jgi:hypothetical protein